MMCLLNSDDGDGSHGHQYHACVECQQPGGTVSKGSYSKYSRSSYLDSRATSNGALELEHSTANLVLHGRLASLVMNGSSTLTATEETTSLATRSGGCGHSCVMLARAATAKHAAAGTSGGVGVTSASERHDC